jgi:hypothetical protein
VRLRVTLRMTGGVNQFPTGFPPQAMDQLAARDQYTCRAVTYPDLLNVLDVGTLLLCVNHIHVQMLLRALPG